jgi:hypothetical protein
MVPHPVGPDGSGVIPMAPRQSGRDGLRPCWTAHTAMRVRERRRSLAMMVEDEPRRPWSKVRGQGGSGHLAVDWRPTARAIVATTSSGSPTAASGTNASVSNPPSRSDATSNTSRVLPTPAGPPVLQAIGVGCSGHVTGPPRINRGRLGVKRGLIAA